MRTFWDSETREEMCRRVETATFTQEQAAFRTVAARLAAKPVTERWPEHPAFGPLAHRAWGVLEYRHTDHHLRQFGV